MELHPLHGRELGGGERDLGESREHRHRSAPALEGLREVRRRRRVRDGHAPQRHSLRNVGHQPGRMVLRGRGRQSSHSTQSRRHSYVTQRVRARGCGHPQGGATLVRGLGRFAVAMAATRAISIAWTRRISDHTDHPPDERTQRPKCSWRLIVSVQVRVRRGEIRDDDRPVPERRLDAHPSVRDDQPRPR